MKTVPVVLFAGGKGTRLAEETVSKPKPMVEIGGRPILWHIMSGYASHGFNDFIVACGYRGEIIEKYFKGNTAAARWRVAPVNTGEDTMTGGRLLRLKSRLKSTFMATYGDGVGSVDVNKLLAFHKKHGKLATVTAVRPPARFGSLSLSGAKVREFNEKPQTGEGWINGGFFVFEPKALSYIKRGDATVLEREPLETLAADGQLMAYKHEGFWHPMDTLRDKHTLENLWEQGRAPWRTW